LARARRSGRKFKKKRTIHDETGGPANNGSEKGIEGYIQNSEQGEESIWQRIQRTRKIFKPMDALYREYELTGFKDLDLSGQDQSDPEIRMLIKYVDDIKNKVIKFDDIPIEHREKLVDLLTRE